MITLEPKRADESRTHRHNWAPFLGEDTIATQQTVGEGVTVDSSTIEDDTAIRFKLSGGTNGTIATVTQSIVTLNGEEETETFSIRIAEAVLSLDQVKEYLRVRHDDEDAKIAGMIPRAEAWVEDHTSLALTQRTIIERQAPRWGAIRLYKGPLVAVDDMTYNEGVDSYIPRFWAGQSTIFPAVDDSFPTLASDDKFEVTYTAGFGPGEVDERLIGAMLALIEGEYAEGYAYPERATQAAERCCAYLRSPVI